MKKIIKLSFVLMICFCMLTSVYAVTTCKVSLNSNKTEYNKGEDVVVQVNVSDIQTDQSEKWFVLSATLEYDSDYLTYEKVEGQNGWTATYTNGVLLVETNNRSVTDGTMATITFKAKQESNSKVPITLTGITIADGTQDMAIDPAPAEITIKNETGSTEGGSNAGSTGNTGTANGSQNNGNNMSNQSGNTNDKTTMHKETNTLMAPTSLPQTGETDIIPMLLLGAIVLTVAIYIGRKIKEKE